MTPEDQLICSLSTLRRLVDAFMSHSPSASSELLQLDFLVRKYPAAARMSLRLIRRVPGPQGDPERVPAPPGWSPAPDVEGVPLWRWHGGPVPVYVATGDPDQLRYLGVALARFDRMTAEQLHAYLHG